jgi:polyhydroxyalkanoate synthesis regulator phasin
MSESIAGSLAGDISDVLLPHTRGFMLKRIIVVSALICFISVNVSSAVSPDNVFAVLLVSLMKEALKSIGSEAGKMAVDRFKALFNANKDLARNKKHPQLSGGDVKGKERIWVVSPTGNLGKDDIAQIARTLKYLDRDRDQRVSVRIDNEDLVVTANQTGVNIQRVNIRGDSNITSTAQEVGSTSIAQGSGSTAYVFNISGLPPEQVRAVLKGASLADEALKKGQTSAEEAKKNIEAINKELSRIQGEKFESLPEDAKKWVHEMSALLTTFQEREALLQESLRKQAEYRENLSQQMLAGMRNLFVEVLEIIDSRVLALEEAKDWGIRYVRNSDFQLFVDTGSGKGPTSIGHVLFRNGSSVDIVLSPGILAQGIAQDPPELRFLQIIDGRMEHAFSFREKQRTGTITFDSPPLVPESSRKPQFADVMFDPKQNGLGQLRGQFISTFTQFIGSVITSDNLLKADH